jgi:hypothetical protein
MCIVERGDTKMGSTLSERCLDINYYAFLGAGFVKRVKSSDINQSM